MSLLMQALKKAERAKQSGLSDEELAKPSPAHDDALGLTPQAPAAAASAPVKASAMALSLEPTETLPLSLSSITDPHHPPIAAPQILTLDLPPPPRDEPPVEALGFVPEPPPAPKAADQPSPAEPARSRVNAPPRPRSEPAARPKPAAAPRPPINARTVRIAALLGMTLLVVLVFGYIYWKQVYGPGSSRNLPMVPMPGQNNPPASANALVVAPPPDTTAAPDAAASVPASPLFANAPATPAPAPQMAPVATTAPPSAPAPETLAPIAAPPTEAIRVVRSATPEQVNPTLTGAYGALRAGDLAAARSQYSAVLQQDANNRDALLGMAAIAVRERQEAQAQALYLRLLELDPNDNDATAGLIGLGKGDPGQAESRLRKLLQQSPEAAPLLFSLGNLMAREGRWPEAQELYFRAYTKNPDNADYAFNLAVGLDRLNQGKLALGYYQRALALAQSSGGTLDRAAIARRIGELGGQ